MQVDIFVDYQASGSREGNYTIIKMEFRQGNDNIQSERTSTLTLLLR